MKRILIIAMLAGVLVSTGLKAQKVYKDANDRVILDLTVAAGMPSGAVTNTSKTSVYASFNPSASSGLTPNNDPNSTINADVFQKLEVAPHDMNDAGVIDTTGTFTMDWITAFNGCKNSSYNGGRWRLPTQRELMLIWIFRPALESIFTNPAVNGTAFTAMAYLSSTQGSTTPYDWFVWYVDFHVGSASQASNTVQRRRVRCVREVN